MQWRSAVGIVLLTGVVLAGCVSLKSAAEPIRQCSETPKHAVLTFLRGVAEMSLGLIRSVISPGLRILMVFGSDEEEGRKNLRLMVYHPEIAKGNEVGSVYTLAEMADTPEKGTKLLVIERQDQVTFRDDRREEEQTWQRSFLVTFDLAANCIVKAQPREAEWVRVR